MKLSRYLGERGESQAGFARRAGLDQRTVNRVARGEGCNAETALTIIRASHDQPTPGGGSVSLEDLVPDGDEAAA